MQLKTRWQRMKTAFMELYPRLRTTLIVLGGILVGITMFALLVWVSRAVNWPAWTGFNTYTKPDTIDEREKTLWDWLDLLIVPAVLAGGAYLFNRAERRNESQIAEQRARDATLQAYLDQMTTLLLEKELRKSKPDTEIREVARIRTLTALRRLDAEGRTILFRFLRDSKLSGIDPDNNIIDFRSVDLSRTDLSRTRTGPINFHIALHRQEATERRHPRCF